MRVDVLKDEVDFINGKCSNVLDAVASFKNGSPVKSGPFTIISNLAHWVLHRTMEDVPPVVLDEYNVPHVNIIIEGVGEKDKFDFLKIQ